LQAPPGKEEEWHLLFQTVQKVCQELKLEEFEADKPMPQEE
jgi:hypothetical protein